MKRLSYFSATKANRVQSPAGSPDFRKWESCRTMPLISGFSRGFPVSPTPLFRRHSIFTPITLIGSQDLAVKDRPKPLLLTSHFSGPESGISTSKVMSPLKVPEVHAARLHCTPVQSLARRADGAFDRRGSVVRIAPALLNFKRGKYLQRSITIVFFRRGTDNAINIFIWNIYRNAAIYDFVKTSLLSLRQDICPQPKCEEA
ncbi:hypothetical protein PR048_003495 [Dryococelus australis]|uniref:Uncharacterized protein n=1 Tax=Dryococelus australis TaxID=614101 RepID=A0ABQ9IPM9_9NEOP|nr:hypothetical protein PR048_003495 [Dryococelus australis]